MMHIRHILWPVRVLGPGERLGIWFSGCGKRCHCCMSPRLQQQVPSDRVSQEELRRLLLDYAGKVDGVTISGGEPLDQARELALLVDFIMRELTCDILLYSGYDLADIVSMPFGREILSCVSAVISGPYDVSRDDGRGIRGSSNQEVTILKATSAYQGYDLVGQNRAHQLFTSGSMLEQVVVGVGSAACA